MQTSTLASHFPFLARAYYISMTLNGSEVTPPNLFLYFPLVSQVEVPYNLYTCSLYACIEFRPQNYPMGYHL